MELNSIYNENCLEGMKRIPNNYVDCVLTDPPYLYLKNQKLDRPFNEEAFFREIKRVLKKDGFIVMFGRGTSFYRWNTTLADLGFNFKEEFVWDKCYCTSPLMAISRVHETISIHTLGNGKINKVKVPYLEMKKYDIGSICQDINRMKSILKNTKSLDAVLKFLENNSRIGLYKVESANKFGVVKGAIKDPDRSVNVINSMVSGMKEKTIIREDREDCDTFTKFKINADKRKTGDRSTNCMQSITFGMNEKSIIKETRDHYSAIHPTQKPVKLLQRLLLLASKIGDVVLDPFSGSASTAIACMNTDRKFIGFEIDKEYYDLSVKRIKEHESKIIHQLGCLHPDNKQK